MDFGLSQSTDSLDPLVDSEKNEFFILAWKKYHFRFICHTSEKVIRDFANFQTPPRGLSRLNVVIICQIFTSVVGILSMLTKSLNSERGLLWRASHFCSNALSLMCSNKSLKSYKIWNKNDFFFSILWQDMCKIKYNLPNQCQQSRIAKILSAHRHYFFWAIHDEDELIHVKSPSAFVFHFERRCISTLFWVFLQSEFLQYLRVNFWMQLIWHFEVYGKWRLSFPLDYTDRPIKTN